jgi:hypothetical protein
MPNPTFNEAYEDSLIKENIVHLKEFLDKLNNSDDWENIHKYKITEYFPLNNTDNEFNTYELINLRMEIAEDGVIYCDDAEGILEEYMYNGTPLPLQSFCLDNVIMIGQQDNEITITLQDGYIKIIY